MNKIEVLQKIIDKSGANIYLEIGVDKLETFNKIKAKRKIAVDPVLSALKGEIIKDLEKKSIYIVPHTSDYFFEYYKLRKGLDAVFIDGLHTYKQALKDIINSLDNLNEKGVIVVHDCFPPNATAAYPADSFSHAASLNLPDWIGEWCGDVWKSICCLRCFRKDLNVFVLDTDYGLGIITRGISENSLDLTRDEIDRFTYTDLVKNKEKLLNLKQIDFLDNFLKSL